ncbi:Multifunctional non-homologous end joining protein LigD [Brevundimonas sp. NIBR11]|nr:Multifunctional non-homologous end joining protein LigD [Brevundimonas sp. NIBR11]
MPASFQPLSHPTLEAKPPAGRGWIHEIKFDGWRVQLNVSGGVATWWSRNGNDLTERLPRPSADAAGLEDCILDGELCAVDADGNPNFSLLKGSMNARGSGKLVYFAFDILWRGESDLRPYALSTRKKALSAVLEGGTEAARKRIHYVDHFEGISSADLIKAACNMRLEGIVSKQLGENYRAGRTSVWIKSKCRPGQEVVVGGWKSGSDGRFKSLLTGVYERGELRYAGSLKNGFRDRDVSDLRPRLKALSRARTPFAGEQPKATGGDRLHFVEPELVAQAEIAEWTGSGRLRQASFKGLREDKAPTDVRREG